MGFDALKEKERITKLIEKDKDLVIGDDGFVVFWPTENRGAFDAWHLRLIADEIDKRNEPWEKQINEYFKNNVDTLAEVG